MSMGASSPASCRPVAARDAGPGTRLVPENPLAPAHANVSLSRRPRRCVRRGRDSGDGPADVQFGAGPRGERPHPHSTRRAPRRAPLGGGPDQHGLHPTGARRGRNAVGAHGRPRRPRRRGPLSRHHPLLRGPLRHPGLPAPSRHQPRLRRPPDVDDRPVQRRAERLLLRDEPAGGAGRRPSHVRTGLEPQQGLGRHLGRGRTPARRGLDRRDPHPVPHPAVRPGADDLGLQRAADHSRRERGNPVGGVPAQPGPLSAPLRRGDPRRTGPVRGAWSRRHTLRPHQWDAHVVGWGIVRRDRPGHRRGPLLCLHAGPPDGPHRQHGLRRG